MGVHEHENAPDGPAALLFEADSLVPTSSVHPHPPLRFNRRGYLTFWPFFTPSVPDRWGSYEVVREVELISRLLNGLENSI